MTPQEQAVVEAAKAFRHSLGEMTETTITGLKHWSRLLADAYAPLLEALEEYEPEPTTPVLPPEPEDHSVIRIVDANGHIVDVLERDDSLAPSQPERHWWRTGMPSAQTWEEVWSRGQIVPLVPASSAFPVDLAREMAEALRLLLDVADEGRMPLPSTVHTGRIALARVEAATGGAAC